MVGRDDDDDGAYDFDDCPTVADGGLTPVPDVGSGPTKTLTGYEPLAREMEIAQARVEQRRYDMMALKLAMMNAGVHVLVADAEVNKLLRWMALPENDALVRAALRG